MSKETILIVDDEINLAEGIRENLDFEGYETEVAYDGSEGLEKLRAQEFDLVLLDLSLPDIDGRELLRTIRARNLDTAVIVLTARGALDEKVRGLDLGADDYITKPFEVSELEARVRVALRSMDRDLIEMVLWEVEALLCCGPAGGGGYRGQITPGVVTHSAMIDRDAVSPTVKVYQA